MKIELIGTGAIYSKYNSACTLINEDMMVDFPNGTLKQLLRSNHTPENIDKIIVTHMHGDHIADIPFLMLYKYKEKKIEEDTYIIGPKGTEKAIKQLFEAYNFFIGEGIKKHMKFIELEENQTLDATDSRYKIQSFPVLHGKMSPAYGYIIDNKLGLTGDSGLCETVRKIIKNSNVIIADCSNIQGNEAHMGIDNLSLLAKQYNKTIIPTHMKDTTRAELNQLNIDNILTKIDGDIFEL